MKQYKITVLILFLALFSNYVGGVCLTKPTQKVSANGIVVDCVNSLRVKLKRKALQPDASIDKHMVDIANIHSYNDLDSLRESLRQLSIYDYDVRLFKFERNRNTPTLESDIEGNNKQLMTALSDSGYNKIGVLQEQDYIAVLLVKNEMSIDSIESTMQFTKDTEGNQKNELLYNNIIGKTTKSKLYYIGLHDPNDINKVDKNSKKREDLSQDGENFKLRVNPDVNSIGFLDENNNVICIYKIN